MNQTDTDVIINERPSTVLVVDDDPVMQRIVHGLLNGSEYQVESVDNGNDALVRIGQGGVDVCLLDLGLPGLSGMQVLQKFSEDDVKLRSPPAVIVISARDDMQAMVQAVQLGAYDYLVKPLEPDRLLLTVKRAQQQRQTTLALSHLVAEEREDQGVGSLIGRSEVIRAVYKAIGAVSTSRATVLITGESGTGKELVARAIHYSSEAAKRPFAAVNCTAFPHHLLESELFGHVRGSFTGAIADKIGRFQLAGNGTLFLDEIGELPLELQAKLLRVLQERTFERVGDVRSIPLAARIVAATNRDLQQMVRDGTFREDLYYRLRIVEIHLPPLRERREDIPLLVDHLLRKVARETHRRVRFVAADARELLNQYDWPGNVRELENALTRGVVLTAGEVLTVDRLPISRADVGLSSKASSSVTPPAGDATTQWCSLREKESQYVARVLAHTGWNKRKTCAILKVTRPTLDRKIRDYDLKRPE